ncbi:MAG TPA: DNA-formamidopyrimidine glycosylase family protein, partial [Polyangiales bacterium]|nr:DNA-formamidopyrimidine glycosylase family protein [Polyangiales bacterium]
KLRRASLSNACKSCSVPEGDTLHRAARQLAPRLMGKAVRALDLIRRADSTAGLVGQPVTGVEARGKNLLVHFEGGLSLHVHLKMNGRILLYRQDEGRRPGPNAVAVLDTDEHRVIVDHAPVARLIRTQDLVRDLHFRNLGPDLIADNFDLEEALTRLRLRKEVPLGQALMDQSAVAGIGNVWKSELCFNLKLDPFAPVAAASEDELRALLSMARKLMIETVERAPRRLPDPFAPRGGQRQARLNHRHGQKRLSVYERAGERCYDCGTSIQMKTQGEQLRSTYYCPSCQPSRSSA